LLGKPGIFRPLLEYQRWKESASPLGLPPPWRRKEERRTSGSCNIFATRCSIVKKPDGKAEL
jgi:hypothetical protein